MITNAFIGYVLCIVLFVILFYKNVWSAMQVSKLVWDQ